jgi:hypothetical protein
VATANIDLKDGTKILIEGTPEEIVRVLALYKPGHSPSPSGANDLANAGAKRPDARKSERRDVSARSRTGAMQHIRELIHEDFFSERRSIAHVQAKLEELGRIYPQTHLSTPLRRLVMNKELRRLRDGTNWAYVDA